MSHKGPRTSSPSSPPSSQHLQSPGSASKLPRFLQKARDRSKSVSADPSASTSSIHDLGSGTNSMSSSITETPVRNVQGSPLPDGHNRTPRKGSNFLFAKERRGSEDGHSVRSRGPSSGDIDLDEGMPLIIEPTEHPYRSRRHDPHDGDDGDSGGMHIPSPRSRTRTDRPSVAQSVPNTSFLGSMRASSQSSPAPANAATPGGLAPHAHTAPNSTHNSTSTTHHSRIGDLPTRLSGWFTHTFSTSTADLSLPTLLATAATGSNSAPRPRSSDTPSTSRGSALLTAAKHGKGHLDKAVRYLLDSDSTPDKCTEPIWLLGVQHQGYDAGLARFNTHHPGGSGTYHPGSAQGSTQAVNEFGFAEHHRHASGSPPTSFRHYGGHTVSPRENASSPPSFRSSTSSVGSSQYDNILSQSTGSVASGSSAGSGMGRMKSTHSKRTLTNSGRGSGSDREAKEAAREAKEAAKSAKYDPAAHWPPVFYLDFTSRVWLTYRSHFATPIKDGRLAELPCIPCVPPGRGPGAKGSAGSGLDGSGSDGGHSRGSGSWSGGARAPAPSSTVATPATTTKRMPWHWGGEKTWSSDTGWGCMLRTGQSLLANALVCVHLGRDWRKPPHPVLTADFATYVHILTWFLDTPDPEAPFSVHRMALAGKDFGTDVGQWFGPSVAAGAIKTLVNAFPDAGLGVGVAVDGVLFETDVVAASHGDHFGRTPRRHKRRWGDRPVLLLLGIRLGIDGVNPIYYETIKLLYTFPQSVGIAGGRPSSSYYFVGSQAENLFYLDPHHARPAIPLRPPPGGGPYPITPTANRDSSDSEKDREHVKHHHGKHGKVSPHRRLPTSPSSTRTGSSTFSYHAPTSPSPLQQQFSTDSGSTMSTNATADSEAPGAGPGGVYMTPPRSPPPPSSSHHGRWRSASQPPTPGGSGGSASDMEHREREREISMGIRAGLDDVQMHYCTAYSATELKTFHCDRVRKMPLSGLDPSMLLGFLCRDQAEWLDLRRRVSELPRTIFSIQDEPPTWPSDSDDDLGLESISEPDDLDMPEDEDDDGENVNILDGVDDDDESGEPFYDTRSGSPSASSPSVSSSASGGGPVRAAYKKHQYATSDDRSRSGEGFDTEEDPVDPVTPGPHSKFAIISLEEVKRAAAEDEKSRLEFGDEEVDAVLRESDDIEDDWVEPSLPTPMCAPQAPTHHRGNDNAHASTSSTSSADMPVQVPSPKPPAMSPSKSRSSASGNHSHGTKKRKVRKQVPVPVPTVRIPASRQPQEHYPFPVTPAAGGEEEDICDLSEEQSYEEVLSSTGLRGTPRMHTARARDGGRTQSGGVKGILAEDLS